MDYDGTLAPIADDPAAAWPHPEAPGLLERLAARHPTVIVTGRDLAALARLLVGAAGKPVRVRGIGLHGAEEGVLGEPAERSSFPALVEGMRRMLASVPRGEGIFVERKGGDAFAVHYRLAADPVAAADALAEWAAGAPDGVETLWGKRIVELLPYGVSKGVAALRVARAHSGYTPVYLGDDVTDEDAFASLNEADPEAITIRVGPGATAARYRLADVDAVIRYLRTFDV